MWLQAQEKRGNNADLNTPILEKFIQVFGKFFLFTGRKRIVQTTCKGPIPFLEQMLFAIKRLLIWSRQIYT